MQTEPRAIDLKFQELLHEVRRYKNALVLDLNKTQKPFNPIELYTTLKAVTVELTAIREMMFDFQSKGVDEPQRTELREQLALAFFEKMLGILESNIKSLETKIVIAGQSP
jgi:hypothetical protein